MGVPVTNRRPHVAGQRSAYAPAGTKASGAAPHPIPRSPSHLRNADTVKRRGCENRQQYAGSLRRGIHPPYLHPRYKVEARRGSTNNGQFHGADHASRKRTQKCRREDKAFSPVLFKSIRTFPRAPSQRAPCRGRHGYSLRLAAGHGSAIAFRRPLCVDAVVG